MSAPTVCAILLTRDRPELAAKAVECFRRQTYENKRLLIVNTGTASIGFDDFLKPVPGGICELHRPAIAEWSIGKLRNFANEAAHPLDADIYLHFDDDDWSHPNRITEQVALLQASGADVVGYSEMLFWRQAGCRNYNVCPHEPGEAWLYSNNRKGYALGTSLCYWRKAWEARHFPDETQGVEDHWCRDLKVVGASSLGPCLPDPFYEPRMIARIHGGNTSNGYDLEKHVAMESDQWRRVPEWDARVRELLEVG